ncbi:MAG TPA: hypothetical protein VJU61_18965 [Polyangiaceae bacterium]|nr:hypothetical protein [Polyangiaceae bacterium]
MLGPRWWHGVVGLAVVACSDGGRARDERLPPPEPPPRDPVPELWPLSPPYDYTSCTDHPQLGWCRNASRLESRGAQAELVRAGALDILAARCAGCHSSLVPLPAVYEPLAIDDLDALVQGGQLVPLHSAESPLFLRAQSGEMPPSNSGLPPLSQAELDLLALFIDTPSFWPQAAATDCPEAPPLSNFDVVFQSVAGDLAALPESERGFYRYLSLTNRVNAACGDAELEGERRALVKGLNLLSLNPSLQVPTPIDDARLLYRIDLRALDWARSIELGGNSFRDVWEAIAAESPYSVEFTGTAAATAKSESGTSFPVLFADHLLDQALRGELYSAILGVRPEETWSDFQLRALGVDVYEMLQSGPVQRAATTRSRLTRADRVVERQDLGARGVLWVSFDHEAAGSSIFEDPLEGWRDTVQAIFTLPNGLFSFVSPDRSDRFAADAEVRFDTLTYAVPAQNAVSCSACHASGLIPVEDELRVVVQRNAREIGLSPRELERIEQVYVEPTRFNATLEGDSSRYQQALSQLGLPSSGVDPVASASLRFDAPLLLRDAAGELGIAAEALAANLGAAPWLSALESGTLGRDDFAAVYLPALCVFTETLENRPNAALCERTLLDFQRP